MEKRKRKKKPLLVITLVTNHSIFL